MRIWKTATGKWMHNSTKDVVVEKVNEATRTAIIKSGGYSENPGSRYSGLKSYYPVERDVFEITPSTDGSETYITVKVLINLK